MPVGIPENLIRLAALRNVALFVGGQKRILASPQNDWHGLPSCALIWCNVGGRPWRNTVAAAAPVAAPCGWYSRCV
ncbi:MAG: hypothetical protein QOJ56_5138 [Mycobacterium sp.]|jgi:hypothetical protein|nr:hypothetical protein [Mycobacterium sp.]